MLCTGAWLTSLVYKVYRNMSWGQDAAGAFFTGVSSPAAEPVAATPGDDAEHDIPSSWTGSSFCGRPIHENSLKNLRRFRILPMTSVADVIEHAPASNVT